MHESRFRENVHWLGKKNKKKKGKKERKENGSVEFMLRRSTTVVSSSSSSSSLVRDTRVFESVRLQPSKLSREERFDR